jgi:hypothetical protein
MDGSVRSVSPSIDLGAWRAQSPCWRGSGSAELRKILQGRCHQIMISAEDEAASDCQRNAANTGISSLDHRSWIDLRQGLLQSSPFRSGMRRLFLNSADSRESVAVSGGRLRVLRSQARIHIAAAHSPENIRRMYLTGDLSAPREANHEQETKAEENAFRLPRIRHRAARPRRRACERSKNSRRSAMWSPDRTTRVRRRIRRDAKACTSIPPESSPGTRRFLGLNNS